MPNPILAVSTEDPATIRRALEAFAHVGCTAHHNAAGVTWIALPGSADHEHCAVLFPGVFRVSLVFILR